MKKLITYALCAICAGVLWNCSPTNSRNYIVINKTKSHIGVIIDYYKIVTIVDPDPFKTFEHYEKVGSHRGSISDFKLSNLNDTASIRVDGSHLVMIRQRILKTKIDTILHSTFSYYGHYTTQWVVTDELLSVMTHDESLLVEFPDFYKK